MHKKLKDIASRAYRKNLYIGYGHTAAAVATILTLIYENDESDSLKNYIAICTAISFCINSGIIAKKFKELMTARKQAYEKDSPLTPEHYTYGSEDAAQLFPFLFGFILLAIAHNIKIIRRNFSILVSSAILFADIFTTVYSSAVDDQIEDIKK